jgi:hypothetical protein
MAAEHASSQTRVVAAAMLVRLQTAQSTVEQAMGQATGRAAQSLAAIAAHLASVESSLAQSLQSGGPLASLDLSAIERLIQMSETNAQAAVAAVRPHVRDRDGGSPHIMWERGLRWIGRRRASHIGDEPWDRIARCMLVWIP